MINIVMIVMFMIVDVIAMMFIIISHVPNVWPVCALILQGLLPQSQCHKSPFLNMNKAILRAKKTWLWNIWI
jgi:hypothetical protein